jgi:hypothetical protein
MECTQKEMSLRQGQGEVMAQSRGGFHTSLGVPK